MTSLKQDVERLIKNAKKKGVARGTFSMNYRAALYSRPWRLIVTPMPAQPPDAASALDPTGTPWNLGATITASLIGGALAGAGEFEPVAIPPTVSTDPQLAFAYEWREPGLV